MGFPRRPRARPVQGSSDDTTSQSTLNSLPNAKRVKLNDNAQIEEEPLLFDRESIRIYIVIAKLSPDDVRDLTRTIESNGGVVVEDFQACTLALSSTRIWNRLRKYLPSAGYNDKRIATLEWLNDSIAAKRVLPLTEKYLINTPSPLDHLHLEGSSPARHGSASPVPSQRATATPEVADVGSDPIRSDSPAYPTQQAEVVLSETVHPPKWQNKRYACQRWHPLVCINQALLLELKWIRDFHRMASDERRSATYAKGMAAIKSYPYLIKSAKEAEAILGVGEKIASQCGEFVKTGKIEAAERVKKDTRHVTLLEFSKIHGVGGTTARELYDKHHCRTVEDVAKIAHVLPSMGEKSTEHVEDFDLKIPRVEVEEIADMVNQHLQRIIPGAEYTITGGYRRGKTESNDVDVLFTHPEDGKEKGALQKLLDSLQQAGLVTDVLYVAMTDSKRDSSMQHFHASHMDPLDKAFTVWKSPANGKDRMRDIHRRVDLIAAPKKYYACAILGWSGSTTFERDLRLWADKKKGMKFDSGGLWMRATSKEVLVNTEREIFEVLDLDYIPPEWRNCDV